MNYRTLLLTIALTSLLVLNAWAQPFYDVYELEVAGVKLGMSFDQATDTLKEKFGFAHLGKQRKYVESRKRHFSSKVRKHPVTKKAYLAEYSFWSGKSGTRIHGIIQAKPGGGEQVVVWKIEYELDKSDPGSGDAMLERAKSKYGAPSFGKSFDGFHSYVWCPKPTENETSYDSDKPTLKVAGARLIVADVKMMEESEEAVARTSTIEADF